MTLAVSKNNLNPESVITAQEVSNYLAANPAFFENYLELLETLHIPHPVAPAVSLLSKQVELLRARNAKLHHQLDELIDIARSNDDLSRRMHIFARNVMEASTIEDVLAAADQVLRGCFMADYLAIRIMRNHKDSALCDVFVDPDHPDLEAFQSIFETGLPRCSHPTKKQNLFIFGNTENVPQSCAFVPMQSAGFKGLLVIGSQNPNHFNPTMGHLFLTQISDLLGSRLEALLSLEHDATGSD